jgi:MarR family transcriptional regulator, organic hydroperoxide resistance regulator
MCYNITSYTKHFPLLYPYFFYKDSTLLNTENDHFFETGGFRLLRALRRIIRAVDIHSRKLNNEFKITTPQMICLCSLAGKESMTLSELAFDVNLGISTVNGIVDRLEAKGLLTRTRSTQDRRKVVLKITESGLEIEKSSPNLLQERFAKSFRELTANEQASLTLSLERIVAMMGAENLETSADLLCTEAFDSLEKEQ